MATEYVGPFKKEYYAITVDGYEVPYVEGRKDSKGQWSLLLDGRFSIDVTEDELNRWMWILANGMAVAAGYTHHGEGSKQHNPFTRQIVGISIDAFDELTALGETDKIDIPENLE
jgi:hypothetical protein